MFVPAPFGQFLQNLGKSSESGRKSSENRQKRYQLINKNGCLQVWNILSLSTAHLTRSLHSLVMCRGEHMYNLSSVRMQCNFIHDIYLRQSGLTYTDHGPSRHSPCYAYRKLSLGLLYSEKMNKRSRYKLIKSYISFWLHLLYERWFRQKAEIKQHSQTHSSDLTKCSSSWQFGTSSCND